MFGKIGLPELILILVIALIIFGPRKLPEIGRSIGKGIREFRQATTEISRTVSLDDDEEEEQKVSPDSKGDKPQEESKEVPIVQQTVVEEDANNEPGEEGILSTADEQSKH